jgi:predicted Zn finger-like uncharacterized protein
VKISCPSCAAKYSIADEKVQDRLAKIRCRKCSATIVIDGKVSPANVYTTAGEAEEAHGADQSTETSAVAAASGVEYSVDFGEGDQRTMALSELLTSYNAGQVTAETYIWADGFSDWKMLQDVPEVVDALNAAASAPAPVAAAPAPTPAPAPSPAPAPARAAARPGRGGAADLFGRIESAGSEDEEVATSAPEPQRASAPLGSSSTGLSSGGGAGTGARNESSVLFSLSALTAGASKPSNAAATASKPGAASREDSGLIDLKALTAAATKSDAGAAPAASPLGGLGGLGGGLGAPPLGVASPLGVAPLGLGSPLGGTTGLATAADLSMPPQGKSKTGLFVGIGLVAVAAAAVAIAFILKPEPPPPVAVPTAVPTTPAPAAAPEPTPAEVTAKPPSTGTAESEDAPDAGAKVASKTGGGGARKTSGGSASKKSGGSEPAAAAPAAPAPAKKKSPCGCASGDLQCAMRCAAGG